MRLVLISIGVVILGIFALYCAAGYFDVIWRAMGDWIVVIIGFGLGWYAGSRFVAPFLRKVGLLP